MREHPRDEDDPLAPIADEPGQDPSCAEPGPHNDGYGLSGTLDSGYDIDRSGDYRRALVAEHDNEPEAEDLQTASPT